MEEMLRQVANFGFPMVLSVYLLVRLEAKIDSLSVSIYKLTDAVENIRDLSER